MGLIRKALDFLKADPPQAADITTPAVLAPPDGLVFCRDCVHFRPGNFHRDAYRWEFAECGADIISEESVKYDFVKGTRRVIPAKRNFCACVNQDGKCPKFSPATKEPEL